jgi:hypothetical protein
MSLQQFFEAQQAERRAQSGAARPPRRAPEPIDVAGAVGGWLQQNVLRTFDPVQEATRFRTRQEAAAPQAAPAPTADWRSRVDNAPLTSAQLNTLREGQNQAIRAYAPEAPVLPPPTGGGLSDDVDARASERRRMQQQYAPQNYWASETGKAMAEATRTGPRAGEAGYAQRADIAAWMEANKNAPKGADGLNIVERFERQQRERGLWGSPGTPDGDLAGEQLTARGDADSTAQALRSEVSWADPALKGQTPLAAAQADVAGLQRQQGQALQEQLLAMAAAGQLPDFAGPQDTAVAFAPQGANPISPELAYSPELQGGLSLAQRPVEAPQARAQALAAVAPAHSSQALATGTGSGAGNTLQPSSAAASLAGVEPAAMSGPANAENPADRLLAFHKNQLRAGRSRGAVLGY